MLPQAISEYLYYLEKVKNYSPHTVGNYKRYLDRFYFYAEDIAPAEINIELINKYRDWLGRIGLDVVTANGHLTAIRQLLRYIGKSYLLNISPEDIELAKEPEREIKSLTAEQIEKLLTFQVETLTDLRDKAIMELLYSTGLRVGELVRLNRDISLDELSVIGKGNKRRLVFVSERARYWILEWLQYRRDNEPALFINKPLKLNYARPRRLSAVSIQKMIKERAYQAGLVDVTPHTFRHSFATNMLRNGADLRSIQKILGHSQISTTQVYLNLTDSDIKNTFLRCH